ncbi:iron uptake porin [Pleurocapsa sp. PCC 7319]|uniref:iron uptake porin n=1 Tax=Pleurocapsa sp. PCC 7319 TaxID=118161 RepID=UPI000347835F|nr:iron uptake porin [Pleurocapsa sp. PCC 7319]
MHKLIRNLLLVSPAVAGLVFGVQLSASAQLVAEAEAGNSQILDKINNYSQEGRSKSRNQVTNVNQLRDVSPTDWAYEALRSLVDRYGCIAGFPNQTYRGSQALTRYEFAAGLNSCLNQIERLIASSEAVSAEDLETINRLTQEFEAELATLGGRVDELESRTAILEDNQFSTTTKLEAEAVFGISSEFNNTDFNEVVFQDRVRLAFVSSFTGEDALYTRLDASNAIFNTEDDDGNFTGFQTTNANEVGVPLETGALTYQTAPNDNNLEIGWLAYYFPLGDKIDVYLPAAFPLWQDFVPTLSPYLDSFTGATGSLSSFAESSPIYKIGLASGGGVGLNFSPLEFVTVSAGFFGGDSFNPVENEDGGLFNEEFSVLGQVTVSLLDDRLQVAGTYVRGQFGADDNTIYDLGVGTADARQPFGDDIKVESNSFGVEAAFQLNDRFALNAFGMYTDAQEDDGDGEADIWSYGAGLSLPDFGKEGNLAAIFAGVEPYADDQSNPIHLEGLYKYQFNDNVSITPGVIYIINPNGNDDDDDALLGVLRTTFTF